MPGSYDLILLAAVKAPTDPRAMGVNGVNGVKAQ
jgi:hypothetical protein